LTKLPDSKKKERLTLWLNTLLDEYKEQILPIDLIVAENGGTLQGKAETEGTPMSSIDSLLAATTYTYNLTLVTINESNFPLNSITFINPWKL